MLLASILMLSCPGAGAMVADLDAEELREVGRMSRRGESQEAIAILDEVLTEDPGAGECRALRAQLRHSRGERALALVDAERALVDCMAGGASPSGVARARRGLARLLLAGGRAAEVDQVLLPLLGGEIRDPESALLMARACRELGQRERERGLLLAGAEMPRPQGWRALLDKGRCQQALGRLQAAARTLVRADRQASEGDGPEPEVLCALAGLYFEVYGELDAAISRAHSPDDLYREALDLDPGHPGALLGRLALARFNPNRRRVNPAQLLETLFVAHPGSIEGRLVRSGMALDELRLKAARRDVEALLEAAPLRRGVRARLAALYWLEGNQARGRAVLAALDREDPTDAAPERALAGHLLDLYRFGEAMPFLEAATVKAGADHRDWDLLGRALAGLGRSAEALAALERATELAAGRQDAWRHNTTRVLERVVTGLVEVELKVGQAPEGGDQRTMVLVVHPDQAPVLAATLGGFLAESLGTLTGRYGHDPGEVRVEVFDRWGDFSVRSTGFEGFPGLGVCFGSLVTLVSPASELRGGFSWASTAYHELTHVLHLGRTGNRVPRWLTEGIATWEEASLRPAWRRDLRRDLVDALANGELIPLRGLNGAFRGPRVLFAYTQSGLLVEMLAEERGFAAVLELLDAFGGGDDLDQALERVMGHGPDELDRRFEAFLSGRIGVLKIEPRWSARHLLRLRLGLSPRPPAPDGSTALVDIRSRWSEDQCTLAWGHHQSGRRVDAEVALAAAASAGALPPRGLFLKGEMALADGDAEGARGFIEQALAKGAEDFRARLLLASLHLDRDDAAAAEVQLVAAAEAFPAFRDPALAAERRLAELLTEQGRFDEAIAWSMAWFRHHEEDVPGRIQTAGLLERAGRIEEAEVLIGSAVEIDPFRRELHGRRATLLRSMGQIHGALAAIDLALMVPASLDPASGASDSPGGEPHEAWILGTEVLRALKSELQADLQQEAAGADG